MGYASLGIIIGMMVEIIIPAAVSNVIGAVLFVVIHFYNKKNE
jgi:hypothetical protein